MHLNAHYKAPVDTVKLLLPSSFVLCLIQLTCKPTVYIKFYILTTWQLLKTLTSSKVSTFWCHSEVVKATIAFTILIVIYVPIRGFRELLCLEGEFSPRAMPNGHIQDFMSYSVYCVFINLKIYKIK